MTNDKEDLRGGMKESKTLVDGLIQRKKVLRMGVYDYFWPDTLRNWLEHGYPQDASGSPANPEEVFDFDLAFAGGWFDILPLPKVNETVEETADWIIRRNGAGASLRYWKNKAGCPEHIDFKMTTRAIWERDYRPHLLKLNVDRLDIKGAKELLAKRKQQGYWTYFGNLFIWENMRQSMGDLCLYESLMTDKDWIQDYNRVYTDFFKTHYQVFFKEVGLPDGIWVYENLGYKTGTFCSPKTCEELLFPYYKEMNDFFHSYGLPVVLHSCGNIESILPLVVSAGFDALNPMEAKAGCDVLRFAERYADKLAFIGGLDVRLLEAGDRAAIASRIREICGTMKALGASYVFASDHSISTGVKYETYQYALEVLKSSWEY